MLRRLIDLNRKGLLTRGQQGRAICGVSRGVPTAPRSKRFADGSPRDGNEFLPGGLAAKVTKRHFLRAKTTGTGPFLRWRHQSIPARRFIATDDQDSAENQKGDMGPAKEGAGPNRYRLDRGTCLCFFPQPGARSRTRRSAIALLQVVTDAGRAISCRSSTPRVAGRKTRR